MGKKSVSGASQGLPRQDTPSGVGSEVVEFVIPEKFTIAQAQHAYNELSNLLDNEKVDKVRLDGEKVKKIDAAGLQLLLCFYKTADRFHKPVEWCKPSQELIESAQIVGLDAELALAV